VKPTYLLIIDDRDWIIDWTFGQIIAISDWLLTVLILLNKCIYGSRQEHTGQLTEKSQVVKIESLA
jgi:hypothetical protein